MPGLDAGVDSLGWLRRNLAEPGGVVVTSSQRNPYPEVTGYWIPTLLREGQSELARAFGTWLINDQAADGGFYDPARTETYVFDTGQVIRGLVALLEELPEAERALRKACDWMLSRGDSRGRLQPPKSPDAWAMGERGRCPEAIHLYALPGLIEAAERLDERRYRDFAIRSRDWYIQTDRTEDFRRREMLSHFFCYVQEALVDLGAGDLAARGMENLERHRSPAGGLPAFFDVPWICTPGTFQAGIIWAKLGDTRRARDTVAFIEEFVNASGGFYGSYGPGSTYFPAEEPSWAQKFQLDARALLDGHEVAPSFGLPPAPSADSEPKPHTLVVVPNDPVQAYVDAGYRDQTDYFNPEGVFSEVYDLAWHEPEVRELYGMKVEPTAPEHFADRVRAVGADCIRAYDLPAGRYASREAIAGVPLIVSVHDTDRRRFEPGLPNADLFLAMSGAVRDRLLEYGARPERIRIFPNRVDTDRFAPVDDDAGRAAFQERFPGRFRVLHVGRKEEQKNLETTLEALAILGDDFVGVFVGRGDDAPYRALAEGLGIAERCHWVESVPNDELPRWYSFADCFCVPSLWEGFGIVFIEAMACGAAVVTSDLAPMNEFIEDGRSGLLVADPHDATALANLVELACSNEPVRERLAVGGRRAAARFDRRRVDREESDIYREVVAAKGRAPVTVHIPDAPISGSRLSTRPELEVRRIDDTQRSAWESLVATSPDAWLFHTWREQVLFEEVWPSRTMSFLLYADGVPVAACPLQSFSHSPRVGWSSIMGPGGPALSGQLVASDRRRVLSWVDEAYRSFLDPDGLEEINIVLPVTSVSSRKHWRSGQNPLAALGYQDVSTLSTVVDLDRPEAAIRGDLHASYRRDIKRAAKRGLTVQRAEATESDLDRYYALHVETYRRTGVEPHPRAYFASIFRHFVATGDAAIFFAVFEGRTVGAANFARWRDGSLYWTGAYAQEGLRLEAAKFLQWEGMMAMRSAGVRYHETGEIFPDADATSKEAGLTLFKRRFGGSVVPFFRGVIRRS